MKNLALFSVLSLTLSNSIHSQVPSIKVPLIETREINIKIPKIGDGEQIIQRSTGVTVHSEKLSIPPIPEENPDSEQVAIVLLDEPKTDAQIKQMLTEYPDLSLRHIFREALYGFSVKGKPASIEKLEQNKQVIKISPAYSYQAEATDSVSIIGGEEARGYFDSKNQRLTGKGVTVGVIDTGVDYNHPDLRRNYAGGHDLVDGDADPMETQSRDGAPTIHGTHVAGIIAANGKMNGVAPDAKIIAYRALGPGGSGTTEQILSAIEQAIKDHVDVLNLSLGNEINGPDLPISLALNKAVDKGIVAVAASGNSGPNVWTVGSPGTASKAISVGASTPRLMIPTLIIEGNRESIRLEPMSGSKEWKLDRSIDVADGGLGRKEDLHSVKNKIALIKRGGITFTKKAQNALDAGAKAVLIYNNMNGGFIGTLEKPLGIPVASLPEEIGLLLKGQIEKGNSSVRVNLIEEQDRLATFSSRGPVTGTWEIKPDVVAPGVAINSTIPGGYMFLQGTSMAAPHVAGACALIKQAHPDWTPAEIKAALMNTARPIYKTENAPYRTYEQGAGRIQIMEAVRAESLVMPSSLRFGRFTSSQQGDRHTVLLNIENKSEKTLHYSFRIPEATDGLRWKFPLSFTLKPNERKNVPIVLAVDPNLFKKKIQDGRIELDVDSETVSIPYIYVLNEPNYPRVMGFDFGKGDKPGTYRYEVYLPGGAEQFGIALFDPQNFRFKGFLDSGRNLKKGIVQKEIEVDRLPEEGTYLAKVFAKKAGREDYIETQIRIINREP